MEKKMILQSSVTIRLVLFIGLSGLVSRTCSAFLAFEYTAEKMRNSLGSSLDGSFGWAQNRGSRLHVGYGFPDESSDRMNRRGVSEPSPLSSHDLERLSELKNRKQTMPLVIMDIMLPGQTLYFSSPDPKFDSLIKHVLSSTKSNEIGIIGLDPEKKTPFRFGVTATIKRDDVIFGIDRNSKRVLATPLKGKRRFQVVNEPWMDPSNSFHFAEVEIVDNRHETLSHKEEEEVLIMHEKIPLLVEKWVESLVKKEKLTPAGISLIVKQIGPMPSTPRERAIWVGALLNPVLPLGLCQEIRPAMLCCRNNHDRLVLASVALKSCIDDLWQEPDQ